MKRAYGKLFSLGLAGGLVAAWLLGRQRQRQALAGRSAEITARALARLGVPAHSATLPGDGVLLHAVLAGPVDGPPVVLLHGFPDCWYSWAEQIPALARAGYRVVALDQRGYNLSDKPRGVAAYALDCLTADVAAVIRGLGYRRAAIAGHDWGGMVAWRLAMDYPEVVDRLIILNAPHPRTMARELQSGGLQRLRSSYMLLFRVPWLPELLFGLSPRGSIRFTFRTMGTCYDVFGDEEVDVLAAALSQPGALTGMLNWYRASFVTRPARRTSEVAAPTLVLWGSRDPFLGVELTEGLRAWVPNLHIRYFPRCRHWIQKDAAAEVNDEILAHLARPAERT